MIPFVHADNHHFLSIKMDRIVKINWSVKGYHAFRIKPHSAIDLKVIEELNNPYSSSAMSVVMPLLHEIPAYLHQATTDYPGRHIGQKMKDIAGLLLFIYFRKF